ncbi:MAG: DUF1801 domain-containing protein [Acidobacteria bacterium]|nr:DUF1801 domain-containing protein [Acidobacteriota bacterium]
MAKTDYQSVEEYLAAQPEAARAALESVRGAVRRALPEAVEGISYQIPVFKLNGRATLYMAGWKKHYSLYPVGTAVLEALAGESTPHEVEKGTIRFPLSEPVPEALIERIARARAQEAAAGKKAR